MGWIWVDVCSFEVHCLWTAAVPGKTFATRCNTPCCARNRQSKERSVQKKGHIQHRQGGNVPQCFLWRPLSKPLQPDRLQCSRCPLCSGGVKAGSDSPYGGCHCTILYRPCSAMLRSCILDRPGAANISSLETFHG